MTPAAGRPLTAEDVEIIRDYWSAYVDADWHLIPEAIRDDFDARLVAVGLAEWRAVTADDLDDAFAHDRGLEAGGSCLDLTALGYLAFKADADGWMPWSGGENPVPGQMVDYRWMGPSFPAQVDDPNVQEGGSQPSDKMDWRDIIAFRLSRPASDQPVRQETTSEHIARDMREGRFPARSEPQMVPSEQPVEAIGAGREEIARIIDPQAWGAFADEQIAYVEKHNLVHSEKWFGTQHLVRRSETLRQADAILALSPASPARPPMGEGAKPAAWMYSHDGMNHDDECPETITRKRWPSCKEPWTEEALSPAPPARTPMGEPVAWIERQNDGTRYGEPKRWPPSDRARSYAQEMGRTIEPLYAAASPARTPMGGPQVLKGVGKINGDGWKDTTSIGEVVYVWNAEKPSPYAPGQYPRIWNEGWSASTAQYDFSPASIDEVRALAAPTPMGGAGWVVSNGNETRWRSWDQGNSIWVDSPEKATRYARREDAELVHAEDEDAWCIKPYHQHDFHPDPKSGIRICADPECRKVERKADRTSVHLEHEAGCLPRGAISGDTNGQTVWLDGFTGGAHRLGIWGGLTLRFVEGDGSEVCRSYVDDALAAPTPMGGEVEALREALEPFAAVANEYDDREDDTFEVWMDAGPVMVRDIREALRLSAFRRARQALAASSPSPAQGGESGHVGTIEVLENLLRSGGETWLNSEQEWALKSAIAVLSASPQPEAGGGATALADLIETRLLGVRPDDQDLVLEDHDWRLILQSLRTAPPSVQPVEGK